MSLEKINEHTSNGNSPLNLGLKQNRKATSTQKLAPVKILRDTSLAEQKLGLDLKIYVAQNITHPLKYEIREAAYLMEDMLHALE